MDSDTDKFISLILSNHKTNISSLSFKTTLCVLLVKINMKVCTIKVIKREQCSAFCYLGRP